MIGYNKYELHESITLNSIVWIINQLDELDLRFYEIISLYIFISTMQWKWLSIVN